MLKKKRIKKIIIASDHAGFKLKEDIKKFLNRKKNKVLDLGTNSIQSVDYPHYAHLLSAKLKKNRHSIGILVCGSGNGMNMTANKHKNVRAALCYNYQSTKLSRLHNNANVMTIGSRLTKRNTVFKCIDIFLETNFEKGRHSRRVKKI